MTRFSTAVDRQTSVGRLTAARALEALVGVAARSRPASADLVDDAIVLEDLAKTYPDGTEAVRGISLRLRSGESYGILGPNGAGKSTTIGMLGTLVRPTGGHARVAGFDVVTDPVEVRRRIGFAMQLAGVDDFATASELMVLQGRLHGLGKHEALERAGLLLRVMGLDEVAGRRLAALSGGTKRRVDLAASLMHLPPIVFLDEPTEGLDPRSRSGVWDTLDELRRQLGITLVLTTHYMDEGDRLCDRIGIIDRGTLVVEGTPQALKATIAGQAPRRVAITQPTLEDVYLHYTGRPLDVGSGYEEIDDESRRAA
jgi:ABC-2 type transport system ATP-binding protein